MLNVSLRLKPKFPELEAVASSLVKLYIVYVQLFFYADLEAYDLVPLKRCFVIGGVSDRCD